MSNPLCGQDHLAEKLRRWPEIHAFWNNLLEREKLWQIDVGKALQAEVGKQNPAAVAANNANNAVVGKYVGTVPGLSQPEDKEVALVRGQRVMRLKYQAGAEPTVESRFTIRTRIGDTTTNFR